MKKANNLSNSFNSINFLDTNILSRNLQSFQNTPIKILNTPNLLLKQSTIKRKFNEIENENVKEEIIQKTTFIKNKINDIYEKYLNEEEWKEELKFELKQENIVSISGDLPRSLNTMGSHLMEYTKFWILFIEMKFSDLDLIETLSVFNNALLYEQNDLDLLNDYLNHLISNNFETKEIYSALEKVNGAGNNFRVPGKIEDLTIAHYKYLLNKPELFSKGVKINHGKDKPLLSVLKKCPLSTRIKKINSGFRNNNFTECDNNNKSSELKLNMITINKIHSNNSVPINNALNSITMFKINDSGSGKKIKHVPLENSEIKRKSFEMCFQADINISHSKLKETKRQSQGVNTSFDFELNCDNLVEMSYKELIKRNKFNLELQNACEFQILFTPSFDKDKVSVVVDLLINNDELENGLNHIKDNVRVEGEVGDIYKDNSFTNNRLEGECFNGNIKIKNKYKKRAKSGKNKTKK